MASRFIDIKPMLLTPTISRIPQRKHKTASDKPKRHFLYSILPESGYICVAELPPEKSPDTKPPLHHKWFNKRTEAIRYIKSFSSETIQIFIAQASFKERGEEFSGRKQSDAEFMRSFFMDIDCGESKSGIKKTYATQDEGKVALLDFCKRNGFPEPVIINSGNGLYAHWPLSTDVSVDRWFLVAKKLKKLVRSLEPGLDQDGIIADYSRVLRPVGSINRKFTPKKVRLMQNCAPVEFETFEVIVDKALAALPSEPVPPGKVQSQNIHSPDNNTASAILIADKCAVIRMVKDLRGNVPEPLWYAAIGVLRHCSEAPEIVHEWSSGHLSYTKEETDKKIEQHKYPPTTCNHFSDYHPELCHDCKSYEKIKSPIQLGSSSVNKEIPDEISELNLIHFVSRIGGKSVVCREVRDEELQRDKLEMSSFADFKNFYYNRELITGYRKDDSPITTPLGLAWIKHPARRQFDDIKLTPEGNIDGVYNLWRGFSVEPIEGVWKLYRKHILYVICNGDKEQYEYVIRWIARLVQQPWTPGEVALVLQGKKGIGKGKFVNTLCRLLGQNSMSIYNGKHLTGNFNAHLEDCILLYVDEAFWAGDKSGESVLKGLITEPTIPIERKGFDLKSVRNLLHIIMSSNNDWVVPASTDERRYCVLKVSEHHMNDFPYFAAMDEELNNGGLAAMLYYFMNLNISDFNVRAIPKTDGLIEQKLQSLDTVLTWWHQKLCSGELISGIGWDSIPIADLYDDYVVRVQKQGSNIRRVSDTAFGKQLRKVLPTGWPKKPRPKGIGSYKRSNHYEFPSLKICRKHFEKFLGVDVLDWD